MTQTPNASTSDSSSGSLGRRWGAERLARPLVAIHRSLGGSLGTTPTIKGAPVASTLGLDWVRLGGDLLGSSGPARVGRRGGSVLGRLGGVNLRLTGLDRCLSSGLDVVDLASYGLLDIGVCLLIGVGKVILLVTLGTWEEKAGLDVKSGAGLVAL